MKKINKLQLNKETIAQLTKEESSVLIGGQTTYPSDDPSIIICGPNKPDPQPPQPSGYSGCTNYTNGGVCFTQGLTNCG